MIYYKSNHNQILYKGVQMQQFDLEKSSKSSSSFSMYMRQLNKFNTLNIEEQKMIGQQLKDPKTRQSAKDKLITSNLRLVVKIAHDYMGIGLGLEDLVQQGNLGLVRAVETFDSDKGVKFSTYSSNWIKNFISRAINKKGRMIRVPIATEQKRRKLKKYIEEKESKGIIVSQEMMKKDFGYSDLELKNGLKKTDFVVSMNNKYDDTDNNSDELGQILTDLSSSSSLQDLIKQEDNRCLHKIVNMLPQRQKIIINMRFGLEDGNIYTLKEVASKIGKTYQRVRQLERDALRSLRTMMKKEYEK